MYEVLVNGQNDNYDPMVFESQADAEYQVEQMIVNDGYRPEELEIRERGKTMKKSVNMTSRQVRNMLGCAFDNAIESAKRNAKFYIALNPDDAERRNRDLDLELCGIENLYHKMLSEIERAEKIG